MQLVGENYQLTGEIDPLYLVNKYGAPLYVYDTSIIASQYKRLSTAFDVPSLRINFACKALTNLAILKFMNSLGA
ncbi:MAG TPA: diaminopimelate decarboxylase, partial [Saprospiraceae bacterium]|nr:diaminopimelate decarboxylase [Saprospiraceae bacterium]